MNPVHERDGGRCAACGQRARSVQHRIHGNRSDNRSSNLLSACGDGTRGCHGWMEHHRRAARANGWEVSKFGQDPAKVPAWYENGPYGQGWYLLDDDYGFAAVPGSPAWQAAGLDKLGKGGLGG